MRKSKESKKTLGYSKNLKVFCKKPNESVVESIGSVAELNTKPQRNCNFQKFETELKLDLNGMDWNGINLNQKIYAFISHLYPPIVLNEQDVPNN